LNGLSVFRLKSLLPFFRGTHADEAPATDFVRYESAALDFLCSLGMTQPVPLLELLDRECIAFHVQPLSWVLVSANHQRTSVNVLNLSVKRLQAVVEFHRNPHGHWVTARFMKKRSAKS
jgi:hypothetical protein